jgi:hypothetical protein
MVEITIVAILLLVAVGGLSGAVLSSLRLSRTTEESSIADDAARAQAARMQLETFSEIFRRYNESVADDVGLGVVPGNAFDVPGLSPRDDDADGRVGRIVFPSIDLAGGFQGLSEQALEPRLGMTAEAPRDLNLDGDFDDVLTNDYALLPVRLLLEWTGAGGDRSYELDLLLVQQ